MNALMPEMPRYKSHKTVWALKIAQIIVVGESTTTDESLIVEVHFENPQFVPKRVNLRGKPRPEAGWYYVEYDDGYSSFSPAATFEAGNTPDRPVPSQAHLPDFTSFPAADLANWFQYHTPTPEQMVVYQAVRNAAAGFAHLVNRHVPAGADKTAAMRKIRECVMAVNLAVACSHPTAWQGPKDSAPA